MRKERRRKIVPRSVVGHFEPSARLEPVRRILGWLVWQKRREVPLINAVTRRAGGNRRSQAAGGALTDRHGFGNHDPHSGLFEPGWVSDGDVCFDVPVERRVAVDDRLGDFNDVADLQPFGLQRGREAAIERLLFKSLFPAKNGKFLAVRERVDGLTPANDPDLIDGRIVKRWIPHYRQVATRQSLRIVEPRGIMHDIYQPVRVKSELCIQQEYFDRGGIGSLCFDDKRLQRHPSGDWPIFELRVS